MFKQNRLNQMHPPGGQQNNRIEVGRFFFFSVQKFFTVKVKNQVPSC